MPEAEFENKILKSEIKAYRSDSSKENSVSLLHCLHESQVFVPGKLEQIGDAEITAPAENASDSEIMKKRVRFVPSMLKAEDGSLTFPVLTSRNEAPVIDGRSISGIVLPFPAVCGMANMRPECHTIIVNPFTDKFIISEQMYVNVLKIGRKSAQVTEQKISAGESVTFFGPEQSDLVFAKGAAEILSKFTQIKKVYFTRMLSHQRMTYLFVADAEDGTDLKEILPALGKKISDDLRPRLPLSLAELQGFERFLGNGKFELIFERETQ